MPNIIATTQPLYHAAVLGANTLAAGITPVGAQTITGEDKTLLSDVSENVFLSKVVGKAGAYNPLPAVGTPLNAGDIYGYGGDLVMVRQSHNRTANAPTDGGMEALFTVYRAGGADVLDWVAGEQVEFGTRRTYGGQTYEAIQAHVTETTWQPPNVPALWKEVVAAPPPGAWAFPVAYKVGDTVTYNGETYRCLQAHTSQSTWTPTAVPALWQLV